MSDSVLPGATLGVLGGGQLGRMFCVAARNMGYLLTVFDPDPDSPAGRIADRHIAASYDDTDALRHFAEDCDVITTEFENVPAQALHTLAASTLVYPAAETLRIAQNRREEKAFAMEAGLTPVPHAAISSTSDIAAAVEQVGLPALLKSNELGYDGKGQIQVDSVRSCTDAFVSLGEVECVLERRIELEREISVIVARNAKGEQSTFPVAENAHRNGILHMTSVPAQVDAELSTTACQQALALATALDYVGVLAVEFFISTSGELLFNEMAPRTHNSGHYTEDACVTSQFEQQVRMMCGLPAGDTRLLSPVVMVNMLGDLWEPDWSLLMQHEEIKLHLYGKREARPGRKMGHFNVLADDVGSAREIAERIYARLSA